MKDYTTVIIWGEMAGGEMGSEKEQGEGGIMVNSKNKKGGNKKQFRMNLHSDMVC